jgi:hypothetical protein
VLTGPVASDISAPMSFFTNTDSGVTMNRFSQDLQLIDMELPIAALNTFASMLLLTLCFFPHAFVRITELSPTQHSSSASHRWP